MIPVRDGVRLQTVILTPTDLPGPLPILFCRTPSGVTSDASSTRSTEGMARDGYIVVIQNLRGRFKSEGVFKLSSQVDLTNPAATSETTDAYDSIDWLTAPLANHN